MDGKWESVARGKCCRLAGKIGGQVKIIKNYGLSQKMIFYGGKIQKVRGEAKSFLTVNKHFSGQEIGGQQKIIKNYGLSQRINFYGEILKKSAAKQAVI